MPKINVMHIIGGGEFGGAEQHIITLLKKLDRKKFNLHLCCLFPEPLLTVARRENINVTYLEMNNKFDLKTIKKFAALIMEKDIDIVHTHGVRANFVGRLGARRVGSKVVVVTTIHSLLKYDYPNTITRALNNFLEKLTAGRTNHFVAVSTALKEDLVTQGINEKKISVIHNGIDLSQFTPGKSDRLKKLINLTSDEKIIGMVARFHPVKGHRYFLEAAKILLSKEPNFKFVLVGDGDNDYIKGISEQLNLDLEKQVYLLGFQKDIVEIMRSLDLLVIPSLSEGFGLTAVEAMAIKVPVVASGVGGLLDIVKDGETGILVPPGNSVAISDAILNLIKNPQKSNTLVENAYHKVWQNFSQETMAKSTENLYAALVSRS